MIRMERIEQGAHIFALHHRGMADGKQIALVSCPFRPTLLSVMNWLERREAGIWNVSAKWSQNPRQVGSYFLFLMEKNDKN